jgi:UDP:flavonoid glycosyltransferase YjiC (YdhE family)
VEAEELGPLPANVEVRDFVDGRDVLRRASVHISHCGCNSVHESLLAGVPLVCMPQAYDQFPLAGRLAGLGAGRFADETARDVRAAVRHLLEDPGPRRRARELGDHLASYDGAGRTNAVVDRVLAEHAVLSVCPVLARVRRVRAIRPR